MSADEAKAYGLIDEVIVRSQEKSQTNGAKSAGKDKG